MNSGCAKAPNILLKEDEMEKEIRGKDGGRRKEREIEGEDTNIQHS